MHLHGCLSRQILQAGADPWFRRYIPLTTANTRHDKEPNRNKKNMQPSTHAHILSERWRLRHTNDKHFRTFQGGTLTTICSGRIVYSISGGRQPSCSCTTAPLLLLERNSNPTAQNGSCTLAWERKNCAQTSATPQTSFSI